MVHGTCGVKEFKEFYGGYIGIYYIIVFLFKEKKNYVHNLFQAFFFNTFFEAISCDWWIKKVMVVLDL